MIGVGKLLRVSVGISQCTVYLQQFPPPHNSFLFNYQVSKRLKQSVSTTFIQLMFICLTIDY